jgi:hypothetical protein
MRKTLIKVGLLAACAVGMSADTILVSGTNNNLYSLNPTTGALTLIGAMGVEMFDIALTPGGQLYGVGPYTGSSFSGLYSINPNTGASTLIGTNTGADLNSFDIGPNGTAYATQGGISPSTPGNSFYTLNLGTGVATLVSAGNTYNSAGDLDFIGGTLYLTSLTGIPFGSTSDHLFTVNPATGAGTDLGSIGFSSVFGLAYQQSNNTLYGIANPTATSAEVITIDPATGAGSGPVAITLGGTAIAFNITGMAVADVPEPATLGVVGLGLAGIFGLVARRRRKLSA